MMIPLLRRASTIYRKINNYQNNSLLLIRLLLSKQQQSINASLAEKKNHKAFHHTSLSSSLSKERRTFTLGKLTLTNGDLTFIRLPSSTKHLSSQAFSSSSSSSEHQQHDEEEDYTEEEENPENYDGYRMQRWEYMKQQLIEYREKHGDTLVPLQFEENPQLGIWGE